MVLPATVRLPVLPALAPRAVRRGGTVPGERPQALLDAAVLRPVRTGNPFESTVARLGSAVRLGIFSDGERLPAERELAERLGVSRQTVREAIAALRAAGLVRTQRGRAGGSVVTYGGPAAAGSSAVEQSHGGPPLPDPAGLADVLDFRRVVEPGAARLAAGQALTAEQRGWLVESLQAVTAAPDPAAHRLADSRLHLAVAALGGSARLLDAVTGVQASLTELLAAIPVLAINIGHSNRQHAAVVQAVLAGRADAARAVMEEHCDDTAALLRGLIG